jgi:hypothetical protein
MFRKLSTRIRISPASPIALLALFVALGGGAYAASGTIGTVDLQNRAVTKAKLARNAVVPGKIRGGAVTRQKLRNGLVNTAKLAPEAVTGPKVNEATLGKVPSAVKADQAIEAEKAQKADTATSAQTAASVGPDGVDTTALQDGAVTAPKLGAITQRTDSISVPAGDTRFESVSCLTGERLIGGGAVWSGGFNAATAEVLHLVYSTPSGNAWGARAYNGTGEPRTIIVRALCLTG